MGLIAFLLLLISEVILYEAPQRAMAVNQYEEPIVIQQLLPEILVEECVGVKCSCVLWIKSQGVKTIGMNAEDFVPLINWDVPVKGSIAVFEYEDISHVAMVETVYPSQNFKVSECNFKKEVCAERVVLKDDPRLSGFIYRANY